MNLQPLLEILSKASVGRVLPYADITQEGDLTIAKIPVAKLNTSDKTDVALRRFSADWLRKNIKNVSVDTKWEAVKGLSWFDNGEEHPLCGIMVLTWWPKPELPEFEQLMAMQRKRREAARKGEN